ncbi:MAG: hypothetical protein ABH815_04130 [Candidatus Omnitrophota bacterium]
MIRNFFKRSAFIIIIFCISGLIFLGYRSLIGNIKSRLLELSKKAFNSDISVGQARLRFPVCLELKDIKIDDAISISSVRIYPSPTSFFIKNKLIISKISVTDPFISIKKEDAKKWGTPEFLSVNKERVKQGPLVPDFLLSKIYIHNGVVSYDKGGNSELEFVDINGEIETPGLYSSKDRVFDFFLLGFLKNRETDFLSPLKLSGRAGPDSMIKANLRIDDIKIKTLGMVHDKYLSRVMREGRLDLNSVIELSESNLLARCLLEAEDVVLKNDSDRKTEPPFLASFILLFNFKNKLVKLKSIQGNLFKLILNRS